MTEGLSVAQIKRWHRCEQKKKLFRNEDPKDWSEFANFHDKCKNELNKNDNK